MNFKSFLLAILTIGVLSACSLMFKPPAAGFPSAIVTLSAQTLPITNRSLVWDAPAATFAVTSYTVTQDGTVIGQPTTTSQPITIATAGVHVFTLTATNQWGTSPPSTPLTVNVVVPPAPGNARIQ